MAKKHHPQHSCSSCGALSAKWLGQCPQCEEWGTLEVYDAPSTPQLGALGTAKTLHTLQLQDGPEARISTHSEELDRVFGGGIQQGSLTLLSGEPGIGKSTLVLTLTAHLANTFGNVLYVSGEESLGQISGRAHRLGLQGDKVQFLQTNVLEDVLASVESKPPSLIILDSIQVMATRQHSSFAGSITQVRLCAELLMEYTKTRGITTLIIGHVTKEGNLAGPRVLEHLVDTVLMLEGDRGGQFRLLRAFKNRFGPCDEVGVFAMEEKGLIDVPNPSIQFLAGRNDTSFGTSITALREGNRAFLIEVQALTSFTKFGYPKRTSVGWDINRLHVILAILARYTHINVESYDVYVNIVGGLKPKETAPDLAVAISVASSKLQKPVPPNWVIIGELGLTGEIRSVPFLERRIKEAEKLGCTHALIPAGASLPGTTMTLHPVQTLKEALGLVF